MKYSVCFSAQASGPVRYAASELKRYLCASPSVEEVQIQGSEGIRIRLSESASDLTGGAFRIRADASGVLVEAGDGAGVVYGAHALLEKMGYRFLAVDCDVIPDLPAEIKPGEEVQKPAFLARELFWREAMDGSFAVRLRLNSARSTIRPEQGGKMMFYNFSHTFDALVPVSRWYDTHPEYFSEENGVRLREKTQLCLTNPDVLRLCTEGVRAWADAHPECDIFSVSMNDWYHPCQCPACRAVDEAEGSHAGTVIRFVNQVAEQVERTHPGIRIHTFAYLYCRRPPKLTRPRDNVIVRLCSIECCFSHPIRACRREHGGIDVQYGSAAGFAVAPANGESYLQDLEGWSRICRHLFIWDYTTNYANYLLPFPNLDVLQENLRLFRDYRVEGVFEQGNFSLGRSSALGPLKIYLLAKLLWNPDADVECLIREFAQGYWRQAARFMLEYVELWRHAAGDAHVGIYDMPDAPWLTDTLLEKAEGLLHRALEAAGEDTVRERVRREALSVRYAVLVREDPEDAGHAGRVDSFLRDAAELGITELFERKDWEDTAACLKKSRYTRDRADVRGISYPI